MTTNPTPKAKTERLIVREIDGETLVYDCGRHAASCLNEFAARVWRACDGETSVAAIAAALSEDERAVLRQANARFAADYERHLAAKIIALLPEARDDALRVLAYVDAILNLSVGE